MTVVIALAAFAAAVWIVGAAAGASTLRHGVHVDAAELEALRRVVEQRREVEQ